MLHRRRAGKPKMLEIYHQSPFFWFTVSQTLNPFQVIDSVVTENSSMEIRIPSTKDGQIVFFHDMEKPRIVTTVG